MLRLDKGVDAGVKGGWNAHSLDYVGVAESDGVGYDDGCDGGDGSNGSTGVGGD